MGSKDDWIKLRTSLIHDNRTLQMVNNLEHLALPLALLRVTIVGGLSIIWGTIRHQGAPLPGGDCLLEGATLTTIDLITGIDGFGSAMEKAGWCHHEEGGMVFPEFFSEFNTIPKKGKMTNGEKQKAYRERLKARKGGVTKTVTLVDTEKEKEKEKEITDTDATHQVGQENNSLPPCPHKKVVDLYHTKLPMCPKIRRWGGTRATHLKARWREHPDLEWWSGFFDYIGESKFLTGRTNGSDDRPPFIADLGWIVKLDNFTKIDEGKYHRSR